MPFFLYRRMCCIQLMAPCKIINLNIQVKHDVIIIIIKQIMVVHVLCLIFHLLIQSLVFAIIVVVDLLTICFGLFAFRLEIVCDLSAWLNRTKWTITKMFNIFYDNVKLLEMKNLQSLIRWNVLHRLDLQRKFQLCWAHSAFPLSYSTYNRQLFP